MFAGKPHEAEPELPEGIPEPRNVTKDFASGTILRPRSGRRSDFASSHRAACIPVSDQAGCRSDTASPPLCPARHPRQSVAACLSIVPRRILSPWGANHARPFTAHRSGQRQSGRTEARKGSRPACL
jgi:hypothetical protein